MEAAYLRWMLITHTHSLFLSFSLSHSLLRAHTHARTHTHTCLNSSSNTPGFLSMIRATCASTAYVISLLVPACSVSRGVFSRSATCIRRGAIGHILQRGVHRPPCRKMALEGCVFNFITCRWMSAMPSLVKQGQHI